MVGGKIKKKVRKEAAPRLQVEGGAAKEVAKAFTRKRKGEGGRARVNESHGV